MPTAYSGSMFPRFLPVFRRSLTREVLRELVLCVRVLGTSGASRVSLSLLSPQQSLWPEEEVEWHLVQRLPEYAPRRRHGRTAGADQLALFS
jgi:hypothetical protein